MLKSISAKNRDSSDRRPAVLYLQLLARLKQNRHQADADLKVLV